MQRQSGRFHKSSCFKARPKASEQTEDLWCRDTENQSLLTAVLLARGDTDTAGVPVLGGHHCPRAHGAGHICIQQPSKDNRLWRKKQQNPEKCGLSDMEQIEIVTPSPTGRMRPRSFFKQKQAPFCEWQCITYQEKKHQNSKTNEKYWGFYLLFYIYSSSPLCTTVILQSEHLRLNSPLP